MKTKYGTEVIIFDPADDDDEFGKLFEQGMPVGDIIWKLKGEIIEPHPHFGYENMFSYPIRDLGIPEELLIAKGLENY
jgi:hypothetical protein